ncbi:MULTISPECIES: hypothetical protein [unclassified Burkholderia]|uniref:hypothetical protein n=1 Tax=Burkholderia sp. AU32357 TaxID=2824811 RepID=UPI00211ACB89|nr:MULTISPECIES: hypothetical protein [unclassified Burkholderia]
MFASNAERIETKAGQAYYALKPFSLKTAATSEIWSVDQVRITTAQGAALRILAARAWHSARPVLGCFARRSPACAEAAFRARQDGTGSAARPGNWSAR